MLETPIHQSFNNFFLVPYERHGQQQYQQQQQQRVKRSPKPQTNYNGAIHNGNNYDQRYQDHRQSKTRDT
jgi:hypothetical protein